MTTELRGTLTKNEAKPQSKEEDIDREDMI